MSILRETASRSEQPRFEPVTDRLSDPSQPQPGSGAPLIYPSEVAEPTRSNTLPQQGNTQPDSGSAVHTQQGRYPEPGDIAREQVNVVQLPADGSSTDEVPFKERVIGVAKKTRGTLLNKPELKEHGDQILQGKASIHEPSESDTVH
ncbi:hypothetical protein EV361DRAFT_925488 [Lentinula raphanica]|uniref:Uncharacterized protein n=1 Tax=Lentinula raphanica TaxID=153919 RepID=A0AA38P4H6_9AGAR|nr:hypothetical protein F5878DRAFT_626615 [Lentinula raphanica]KAJ3968514.1 hypothetical protein EV361DRAFT_925488 [Lentinula raphanica]